MPKKMYIGDGVYAELLDDEVLKLTTEDGVGAFSRGAVGRITNTILLEHEVFHNLLAYLQAIREEKKST